MAKTYTLTSTDAKGGQRSSWNSGYWGDYALFETTGARQLVGGNSSGGKFAVYFKFDQATLSSMRSKTVTSVKFKFTVASGSIPPNGTQSYAIGLKADSAAGASSGNTAWQRSTVNDAPSTVGYLCNQTNGGGQIIAHNTLMTIDLGTTVPMYGLVIGPGSSSVSGNVELVTSGTATLEVTTNETEYSYTLAYDKRGGTGTFDNQTGSNTGTSPSYTFTIRSNIPTRTGYTFLGWSKSSTATSASYSPGGSITVTSSGTTTLYAVWKIKTYTVSYNANGGSGAPSSQTKTHGETLRLRTGTPTRSGYIFQGWATSSTGAVAYQPDDEYTNDASVTLYAVWGAAASTVSAPNGTLNSSLTISITRSNTSYTHDLSYSYGGQTGSIGENVGTSKSWLPPLSLASAFPNATSGVCTITCVTKNGSTTIGTSTTTCTLSIPASVKPTISSFTATPRSSNGTVDGWGVLVKGYSYATLAVSATMQGGATRSSVSFSGPGINSSGSSASANTSGMTTTGSKTWTVTVTDSRGRTATATVTKTVYDYAAPVISKIETHRCTLSGTISDGTGTYVKFKPVFSVSSVNGHNSVQSAKLKWRVAGGSWSSQTDVTSGTYTSALGSGNIDLTKAYEVSVTVTDRLKSTTFTSTLPSASGIWYGRGNDRLGLGAVPTGAGLFCDWDATFKGNVNAVTLNGILGIEFTTIDNGASGSITVPNSTSAFLLSSGIRDGSKFISALRCNSGGDVSHVEFGSPGGTFAVSTNTFTITNSSNGVMNILILRF